MPLSVSNFIPTVPGEAPRPPSPPVSSQNDLPYDTISPALTTQRGYRFTGYEFAHDMDGNILFFESPPGAWLTQPYIWSRRATSIGYFDSRAY